jgi:hypothetical protein
MPINDGSNNYFDVKSLAGSLYRPTRYEFYIPKLPELIHSSISQFDFRKDIQFSVESVFFPSRNISSEPIKLSGPVDEIPYEATYSGDLDISIRVSGDFKEKVLFETWMDIIINQKTQNLNYPDNYRCDAVINGLNMKNETVFQTLLTQVWPKSVGRISVGQGQTDSIATMQLQLAYRRYFITYSEDVRNIGQPSRNNKNASFVADKMNQSRRYGAQFPDPGDIQKDYEKVIDPTSEFNAGSDFNPDFIK